MRLATPADGIAWITGASSGIGRSLARRLIGDGWTVALTARRAEALAAFAAEHPGRAIAAPADVTDAAAMAAAHAAIIGEAGQPVALAIANAGTWQRMSARDFDLDAFRRQIEVNLFGTATMLAAVMPPMLARGAGQIGIVASVAGYRGLPMAAAYGASKAALIHLATSLRFELEPAGVLIQVINPGFVKTPMTDVNEFPMPFLIDAEDAVSRIVRGLATTRFEIAFPAPLVWPLKFLRILPNRLFFAAGRVATRSRRR